MSTRKYKIEVHVMYQKDPIVHFTDTGGSYDNRHFYCVYENRVERSWRTITRYPVHTITKVVENTIENQ